MQTTRYRVLVRRRLQPRLGCARLTLGNVARLLLEQWRTLADACIAVPRSGYIRQIGRLFVVDLDGTQILAYFGNLPLLNEDLLDGAVIWAGYLDAGLVALHLTEWLEGTNRGSGRYIPITKRVRVR
jgi:hypothetical protein